MRRGADLEVPFEHTHQPVVSGKPIKLRGQGLVGCVTTKSRSAAFLLRVRVVRAEQNEGAQKRREKQRRCLQTKELQTMHTASTVAEEENVLKHESKRMNESECDRMMMMMMKTKEDTCSKDELNGSVSK